MNAPHHPSPRVSSPQVARLLELWTRYAISGARPDQLRQMLADAGQPEEVRAESMRRALQRSGVHTHEALEYLDAQQVERAFQRGRRAAPSAAIVERLFGAGAPTPAAAAEPPTRAPPTGTPPTFVAIDFETANPQRDSACSVALVRVEGGRVTERHARLIRPLPKGLHGSPRDLFHPRLVEIHGIRWNDVRNQQPFREVWMELAPVLEGARFLVAHNAPFDRSVLEQSCQAAGLRAPDLPFVCTVQLTRECWDLPSARLPVVARALGLPLEHHDPLSDATACAHIAIAAWARRPDCFPVDAKGELVPALAAVKARAERARAGRHGPWGR